MEKPASSGILHMLRRFIASWREQGFRYALERSKARLSNRLHPPDEPSAGVSTPTQGGQTANADALAQGRGENSPAYVPLPAYDLSSARLPARLVAFYLPQFHPIPENDAWWGKGFTEWSNVSRAVPNFAGHYQPHLPGELGFYDLRLPAIQQRQVELARQFGIGAFCFYYYWFDGTKLLELPLRQFLALPGTDFPFCLCWANENWTRTWDGLDSQVLIAQQHSPESDVAFIQEISPYLEHPRYLRLAGRPLLLVYRPNLLPDPAGTALRWRQYCREHAIAEPYLVAVQSSGRDDPRLSGFDAAAEFPPHGIPELPRLNHQLQISNPHFRGSVFDYRQAAREMAAMPAPAYPLFKTVIPGWDNTPRRQDQPLIFQHASPAAYQLWLQAALRHAEAHPVLGERLVFINAWNEWAESAHLEPDRKFGYAYLDATARALLPDLETQTPAPAELPARRADLAILYHLYYPDLWDETAACLANLHLPFDLYVSLPDGVDFDPQRILDAFPPAFILRCPNRGRDMAPFLQLLARIQPLGYSAACKLHTKKSPHLSQGSRWRSEALQELAGSDAQVQSILEHLASPQVGMIAPLDHLVSSRQYTGANQELLRELAARLGWQVPAGGFTFAAGSMFWFKPAALAPLLALRLSTADFPAESGQVDGTLAHALERFIGMAVAESGYQLLQTGSFSPEPNLHYPYAVPFNG